MKLPVRSRHLKVLVTVLIAASGLRLMSSRQPGVAPVTEPRTAADQHWQLGNLELRSCDTGSRVAGPTIAAWCADMAVPENRAVTKGRQITLHLAVIRSNAQKPANDLLVYLAGGPGAAATEDYPAVAPAC
jgi:hypothetical protein